MIEEKKIKKKKRDFFSNFKLIFDKSQNKKEKVKIGKLGEDEAIEELIEFIKSQSKIQEYLENKEEMIAGDAWNSYSEDEFINKEREKFKEIVDQKLEEKDEQKVKDVFSNNNEIKKAREELREIYEKKN